jgi:glucuronate isomerase
MSDIMIDVSYISVSNNVRAFVLYQRKFVHARVLEALWASMVKDGKVDW